MANRNNTVAARLSEGLLNRFNAVIEAEIAARPPVDEMDRFGQGAALRARTLAGMSEWPHDAIRHTFATYAVALLGDASKVSLWLGHEGNSSIIHRHYRGLATKAQAEAFFALRP